MHALANLAGIFYEVVLPILLLAAAGYGLHRSSRLDLASLARLQLGLFVPAFLFVRIAQSDLSWADMGLLVAAMLLAEGLLALPIWLTARARRIPHETTAILVLSSIVFNAGNFGIPLAERAYGRQGGEVQSLILMAGNLTIWALGYLMLSGARHGGRAAIMGFARTPLFAALLLGLAVKASGVTMPGPLRYTLELLAAGLVPLALVTLGAQLAQRTRAPHWGRVLPVAALKMLGLPLVMTGVVFALGLWPWPGAMLILAASAPTAVNTLLLSLELEGDSALAADCVFVTTLASAVTVTITLALLLAAGGGPTG